MKTSSRGIAIIKKYESCKLKTYKCPAGVWTIGWGHTKGVKPRDICTQEQADKWLEEDLIEFERIISIWFPRLNQHQFDAMVSLCFNIGPGNLRKSPIYNAIKTDPGDIRIKSYFQRHVYADGSHNGKDDDKDGLIDEAGEKQKLEGLIRRRTEEANLYTLPL
ncbi:MAG: lysozyme [Bacteroidales bacterium]|nr:lysozyme [Bacteroidales bacterium]